MGELEMCVACGKRRFWRLAYGGYCFACQQIIDPQRIQLGLVDFTITRDEAGETEIEDVGRRAESVSAPTGDDAAEILAALRKISARRR